MSPCATQSSDEPTPVVVVGAAIAPSGVDRAQVESMLDLSPIERLRMLEDWIEGIEQLRAAMSTEDGGAPAR